MKTKVILPVLSFGLLMLIVLASCQEEDELSVQQQALMNKAMTEMQIAYDNAESHNDSLIRYDQDSMQLKAMAQHCDAMFHQQDSLFASHYNICRSINSDGGHSGGMMGSGMMGNAMVMGSMGMDCVINGMDCQSAINSLRRQHAQYCLRQ